MPAPPLSCVRSSRNWRAVRRIADHVRAMRWRTVVSCSSTISRRRNHRFPPQPPALNPLSSPVLPSIPPLPPRSPHRLPPTLCQPQRESEQPPQPPPPRDTSASDSLVRGAWWRGQAAGARASVGEVVRGAVRAVEDAPVETVGAAAAASGLAVLGVVFATSLLGSLDSVPLAPGVHADHRCRLLRPRRQAVFHQEEDRIPTLLLSSSPSRFPHCAQSQVLLSPLSPRSLVPGLGGGGQGVGMGVQGRLRALEAERDVAVAAAGEMRRAGQEMARVVAEKEALEAVALQLADERDSAIAEVTALKTAVNAMTERMRAIEAMLASEVQRLQEQNLALETVALQLADERDSAIKQASELRSAFEAQREEDKRVLEMLAAQLIEERNAAVKEVQELKQVVAGLAEATGAGSGLTSEMEAFIRSRVRAVRAQFVDISKPYSQQEEAVNAFVAHLVDEFGAPREWTHRYIRQFLDAASDAHAIALNGPSPPSDRFN
ncbi:unnamed protein product [Closterium sp. Yama58-4]|nr:unnamed protein product [Closterium sp. Yama58-4]